MREAWMGELVGRMHTAEVSQAELAKEIGCTKAYVSMLLNGKRIPKGGRERLEAAYENILRRRAESTT